MEYFIEKIPGFGFHWGHRTCSRFCRHVKALEATVKKMALKKYFDVGEGSDSDDPGPGYVGPGRVNPGAQ